MSESSRVANTNSPVASAVLVVLFLLVGTFAVIYCVRPVDNGFRIGITPATQQAPAQQ